MSRAVFLDRDGVINEVVERDGRPASPRTAEEFRIIADVPAAVTALRSAGFRIFVVTNQPDVARGLLPADVLQTHSDALRAALVVDGIRVCPHDDDHDCRCRKPRPGMLQELAREWHLELARCFMVGDSWRDVAAGRAVGCTTVLLERAYNRGVDADIRARTMTAAAAAILSRATPAIPQAGGR